MSDDERSAFVSAGTGKSKADDNGSVSENTPLISSSSLTPRYDGEADEHPPSATPAEPVDLKPGVKHRPTSRFPSLVAIVILALVVGAIVLGCFIAPARIQEYVEQAAIVEPTNLAIESITNDGIRVHIQANVRFDGSRAKDDGTRSLGRFATSIVRTLSVDSTNVTVFLPDHDNVRAGTVVLPPLTVSLVDAETTKVDVVTEMAIGEKGALRDVANQFLQGKLDSLRVMVHANVSLKSGIIPLGTHYVSERFAVEANNVPSLPSYNITRMVVSDIEDPQTRQNAIGAHVTVEVQNPYPVDFRIPAFGFEVLVPSCNTAGDPILVADGATAPVAVRPRSLVTMAASGIASGIPESLTRACPDSIGSPLDKFLKQYLHGEATTVLVRGRHLPGSDTPPWVNDLLSGIMVPVPFPGRSLDNLVRNISLADLNIKLPDPLDGGDDGKPRVSARLEVLAALPPEMNLNVNVTNVRARADVFYRAKKLGELHVEQWQPASSSKIRSKTGDGIVSLKVLSQLRDVPLEVTDGDVFSDVVGKLLFGSGVVLLDIAASVDGRLQTSLGKLEVNDIPSRGTIPVKPLPGPGLGAMRPRLGDVKIISTTRHAIELEARVDVTNPTNYTADVPYLNLHVYKNGSLIGEVTARGVTVKTGGNTGLRVSARWDPLGMGGESAAAIGRELASEFISGYNTSITAKTHRNSIPQAPVIGEALSNLNLTVDAPRFTLPGPPSDRHRFIRDATFHFLSSTAIFVLASPLSHDTVFIETIDAVALYNHTETVGYITYRRPFPAGPGLSRTPRLPVEWSFGSVGYGKVKDALGGDLRLDALANVTLRIGEYRETVWYEGKGIGARIRL